MLAFKITLILLCTIAICRADDDDDDEVTTTDPSIEGDDDIPPASTEWSMSFGGLRPRATTAKSTGASRLATIAPVEASEGEEPIRQVVAPTQIAEPATGPLRDDTSGAETPAKKPAPTAAQPEVAVTEVPEQPEAASAPPELLPVAATAPSAPPELLPVAATAPPPVAPLLTFAVTAHPTDVLTLDDHTHAPGGLNIIHEHDHVTTLPPAVTAPPAQATVPPGMFPLTILHTNDVHARFISFNDQGRPCTEKNIQSNVCWGGAARRQTAMKKFLAEDQNVLKLDGGDQFQGTLWYTALKWEPIAQYMNIMKYDAMVFGNHEFDDGMIGLEPFVRNMTTPIVSSNIEDSGSPIKDLFHRKIIKEVGGQKIGIVGCTTTEVPSVAKPGPQLQFIDEVRALQPVVDELKAEGVNKIIVLSHAGIKKERQICKHVRGVDIVVGGHSHTFLWSGKSGTLEVPEGPYPEVYGNDEGNHTCLAVQDYAYGKYLGRLKVLFDQEGNIVNWTGSPVPLDARNFPEDPEIANLLSPYQAQLAHFQKTIVADTAVKLDGNRRSCRVRECNLGNLLADAALYFYVRRQFEENQLNSSLNKGWTPASIALWNSGGVRDYEATPGSNITLEDLYTIMPFGNTIDKVTVKGIVLKEAFEHAVAKYVETLDDPEGRFLQVSGIKVIYDLSKPAGQRVKSLKIRCNKCGVPSYHPVDYEELYDVVTHTYVSSGGDGYTMLRDKKVGSDGSNMLDVDVVMDYIKSYKPLLTGEELRIEWEHSNGQVDRIPPQLAEFNAGR